MFRVNPGKRIGSCCWNSRGHSMPFILLLLIRYLFFGHERNACTRRMKVIAPPVTKRLYILKGTHTIRFSLYIYIQSKITRSTTTFTIWSGVIGVTFCTLSTLLQLQCVSDLSEKLLVCTQQIWGSFGALAFFLFLSYPDQTGSHHIFVSHVSIMETGGRDSRVCFTNTL